jgi:hypothetical protein
MKAAKILTAADIEANRIADATAHMAAQRAAREAARNKEKPRKPLESVE